MLGPLEVHDDAGQVLEVGGARLRALLILLALEPGRVVTTARLVDALWPEDVPAGVGNALQALVSRLRRAVPGIAIAAHPAGYQLALAPEQVDVARFERLAATGHAQLATDPAAAAATLRAALALWRGPALADVATADFARAAVVRLDELRLTAMQDRIGADLRLGSPGPLVAELEGLVAAHPLREPLVGLLMRALAATGQRGAALATYERTRVRLVEQLGVRPSAELAALHVQLLRDEAAKTEDHPGVRAEPVPTNLPAGLTSLIGREVELARVAELLEAHRLTTLTGAGGAGKTRLAVEAARAQLAGMPDGVWLVELAPVTDPAEVAPTVLAALGLREQSLLRDPRGAGDLPRDPQGRLVAALAGKRALLLLDNCEHLLGAAAELADRILAACPRVRIVATSREPLNITGEALWPVRPLALPPAGDADPEAIRGYAAVQLLAQRARAVRPGFRVDAGNAEAVARICRALDGMPLAIELAAARLRAMAPEELAARLDDRFRLLIGGSRTALPRHQTLRAVVDWSWDLLGDAERALWRRFSVFAGGATLDAVERVCAGGPVAADEVLDLLSALVDKSLLVVRDERDGSRYRMLEIIKAYGQERLDEAGERETLRAAHAAHFLRVAEAAQDRLRGAEQLTWLDRLGADQDNLNAAIRGAVAAGDADTALRLVGAVGWYWWLRGYKSEGLDVIREVLAISAGADPERLAVVWAMGALLAVDASQEEGAALEFFQGAAEHAKRVAQPRHPLLRLVGPLEAVFIASRDAHEPAAVAAIDGAVHDPDPWVRATALMIRGHVQLNFGRDHEQVERDFRTAHEIYRRLGERWGLSFTLSSLASIASWRGDLAATVAARREALTYVTELGSIDDLVQFRAQLARDLWQTGDTDGAAAALAEARRAADRIGLPELRASVAYTAGELARWAGRLTDARKDLDEAAWLAADRTVAPQFRAMIASSLGVLAAAEGDLPTARERHAAALAAGRESVDAPVIAQVLIGLADLALHEGDPEAAARLLGTSLTVRGVPDRATLDEPRVADAARAALGDAAYQRAYEHGRADTLRTVLDPGYDLRRSARTASGANTTVNPTA